MPNLNLDEAYFDKLSEGLKEELETKGSMQRFHLVYGRRPYSNARANGTINGH